MKITTDNVPMKGNLKVHLLEIGLKKKYGTFIQDGLVVLIKILFLSV